jgi:type I restriction enzyme S subunit
VVTPADWQEVRLGEVCEFVQSIALSRSQVQAAHGVGYIHYGDIHTKFNSYLDCSTVQLPKAESGLVAGVTRLKIGDLVLADASEDMSGVGKGIEIMSVPEHGVVAGLHTAVLRPRVGLFAKGFIGQLQNMPKFKEQARVLASGLKVYGLSKTSISKISVDLPPLMEQEAIAEALSDADTAIESLDALIAKKRDVKQAAMQQLLTGRTRLPGFTGDWKEVRVCDLGSFSKGAGIKKDDVVSSGIPCIRYGQIYTVHNSVIRSVKSFVSAEVASTSRALAVGDILFAGSGETKAEIGKCVAYVDDIEAVAGGDLLILSPKQCDSIFLGYALNSPEVVRQKIARAQGDAVVHISAASLATVVVSLPPLMEQEAIAEVLRSMDDELEALTGQVLKLRMVKEGMMQDLLTGKVRLI